MSYTEGRTECQCCKAASISDSEMNKATMEGTLGWGYVVDGDNPPIAFCPTCKAEFMKRNKDVTEVYTSQYEQEVAYREKRQQEFNENHYKPYLADCVKLAREMCGMPTLTVVPPSKEVH